MNPKKDMYDPPRVNFADIELGQLVCASSAEDKYEFFENPGLPVGDGGVEQMF
ncbi:MAG: hypothetical protein IJ222_01735 [Bacteroidales bacterium]|nr:hypothetical protein [Bacteroidales bacterium]